MSRNDDISYLAKIGCVVTVVDDEEDEEEHDDDELVGNSPSGNRCNQAPQFIYIWKIPIIKRKWQWWWVQIEDCRRNVSKTD